MAQNIYEEMKCGAEFSKTVLEHGQLSTCPTLQDTALISKIKRHIQQFLWKFNGGSIFLGAST